ncbi:chitin disaccharide deacetylase [uncultured Ilyobacter sp.]|uniref:chitin disaccharide deacetylase n=1 Tax=uncultured Ilyobacter sp. TaxID=544433 RepID=UPI0029C83685|nr:chitin disaccharide deacetylase [uncultured Ilyobacter sp.]
MKLIINADDFGYSKGVNYGIIEAYKNGLVTSTTIMMNMPYVDHALDLYKDNQRLGLGIHFVLTSYHPLTNSKELLGNNGVMDRDFDRIALCPEEVIEAELRAQFSALYNKGYKITHADSHHHVHRIPKVLKIMSKICKEYGLAMRTVPEQRNSDGFDKDIKTTEKFNWEFYDKDATFEKFKNIISKDGVSSLEICAHPAFIDLHLKNFSNYVEPRMMELDVLTSQEAKDLITNKNIEMINFGDL